MPPLRSALLALALPAAAAAQQPTAAALRGADSLAAAEYARDSVASLTVGVVTDRGLVWTRSYGLADVAARRPADRRSVYRIASVTKMFTGLMLQQLAAAGTVRLADPAERFYPEIREVEGYAALSAPITLGQLATMTAGLAREPRQAGPFWTGPASRWQATLRAALPHTRVEQPPGARFHYSNVGYTVLGATLERAAGVPYLRWQRERVLDPLEMRHTSFELDERVAADLAPGYDVDASGRPDGTAAAREAREGRGYKVPNGAVFTTVDDLGRFLRLWLGHGPPSVLPRERLDDMYAHTVPIPSDPTDAYGTGFALTRRAGATWYGHSGGMAGYSAVVWVDRARQVGVIVLRNAAGGRVRTDRLASDLMAHLMAHLTAR
jgi:CubicO group peptidase (beta-lactamase class C family)